MTARRTAVPPARLSRLAALYLVVVQERSLDFARGGVAPLGMSNPGRIAQFQKWRSTTLGNLLLGHRADDLIGILPALEKISSVGIPRIFKRPAEFTFSSTFNFTTFNLPA